MESGQKQEKQSSSMRSTALVAGGTMLSRVFGLVREQVMAYYFGASMANDAFQIAFRIPNLLRDLFAEGAMSSALVPVYTKVRLVEGDAKAWDLVSNVVNILMLFLSGLAIIGVIFSGALVNLYAPAFHLVPGKFELTVSLTRILWPFLPSVALAALWMGILNARSRFGPPAIAPTFFNIISIVSAFTICPLVAKLWGQEPIVGMGIGAVLGGLAQWWIQVPALKTEGYRYRFYINFQDPNLRKMLWMMIAGSFGLAATQINILVNSVFASSLGNGSVSWLNYAFRLMQFPIGVFGVAISVVTLTKVSREKSKGDLTSMRQSIEESLSAVFFFTIPSSVGLGIFATPILSLIYQRGKFGIDDTYQTSMALAGYSLGLTAYAALKVMVPILYALEKAKWAVISSGVGVILNVVFCFTLIPKFGFFGLALSTAASSILNSLVLSFLLEHHIKNIAHRAILLSFLKTTVASIVMALPLVLLLNWQGIPAFRPISLTSPWHGATFSFKATFLILSLSMATVVYFTICRLLKVTEVDRLAEILGKRFLAKRN